MFPLLEALKRKGKMWSQKDLKTGDWKGLTERYLTEAFGPELLEPIEATDESFQVNIKHTDLREFLSMIEKVQDNRPKF